MVKIVEIKKEVKEKQEIKTIQDVRNNIRVKRKEKGSNIFQVKFRVFTVCNIELDDNETEVEIYKFLDNPENKPLFESVFNKFLNAEKKRIKNQKEYLQQKKNKKSK